MLRRLKTEENRDVPLPSQDPQVYEDHERNSQPPSVNSAQMSSLQKYRSQTMKDYGLMIEYKHLRQHVPGGIYVMPSFEHSRVWYGVIFIHTGLYRNGIFKFTINFPENYNGPHTYPQITFNTSIFHPYIHPETKELDLKPKFPEWDPELHYMVAVLAYMKSIFYMKEFPAEEQVVNTPALELFRHDPEAYVSSVEATVEQSLETVYNNESGSSIRFTKHNPAHDTLRRELFAQLDPTHTSSIDEGKEEIPYSHNSISGYAGEDMPYEDESKLPM